MVLISKTLAPAPLAGVALPPGSFQPLLHASARAGNRRFGLLSAPRARGNTIEVTDVVVSSYFRKYTGIYGALCLLT
jgi:hypothetical protein